jgi:ATP-binding cassette subfamily C protein CydD
VGAAEEILKILQAAPAHQMGERTVHLGKEPLCIQYRDVHLAFDHGLRPAVKGISFDLNSGERVVLVGASGAGKTTILNLLLGFLKPDRGQILINQTPLTDLNPASWRRHIAWIGQRPVLFHGTIKDNILLGKPQASEEQLERAARNAKVLDFTLHLPQGLNTHVGERGFGLSRGQAQRVALARAILKDAPILLLDEPTSGLDAENESLVLQTLNALSQGRTVLMLTHRLTNIKRADRILVLENGSIVEAGSYAELMHARGKFYGLAGGRQLKIEY